MLAAVSPSHRAAFALLMCLCAASIGALDPVLQGAQRHVLRSGRGSALDASPWPSDHGDSARAKFTLGAGLPANLPAFKPESGSIKPESGSIKPEAGSGAGGVKIAGAEELSRAQWLYTRGEEDVYALRGGALTPEIVRVDAVTMKIKQRVPVPPSLYIGGALMHGNGHVYVCQGNKVIKFEDGDLEKGSVLQLPSLNGAATQTNGMLAFSDGYLVVKQWALGVLDLPLFFAIIAPYGDKLFTGICVALGIVVASVMSLSRKNSKVKCLVTGGVTAAVAMGVFYILVALFIRRLVGDYNIPDMLTMKHSNYGQIVVVDPDTMQIVTQVKAPERCSYARMALYPSEVLGQDYLVTLGDYSVMKWKYSHATHALELQPQWTERYRSFNDGSFFGTGPAIYNNTVYYTDNTFPVLLGKGYRLYAKSLLTNAPQQMAQLAPDSPGFMFWSVTISPLTGGVIVWDINNNNIQSRRLDDLSLQWRLDVKNMDCLSVAADRGHVYATESDVTFSGLSNHLFASVPIGAKLYSADKYFIVIDTATGNIIYRVPLAIKDSVSVSLVSPGANNDVFVSTGSSLMRVYYEE